MLCSARCFRASRRASSCREFSVSSCSSPQSFPPRGISASVTRRTWARQPRSLLFQEKHLLPLWSASLSSLDGVPAPGETPTPPDLPAPGDALYRSSAARIPNGKQPLGPGSDRETTVSHVRGQAAVAALLPSPPEPCSCPPDSRKAPAFSGAQTQVQAPGRCRQTLRHTSDSDRGAALPGSCQTGREAECNTLPNGPVPVYHAPTALSPTNTRAQAAPGYPKSELAPHWHHAGPYHFRVESPDGRAGCQQLCYLPFLLL